LRIWANYLDCTIVSIDYSLSPQFPFPRPTEEVLYAYAWILKHPKRFGWTGEKVVLCGDSAGANLIVSFSLKMIELNAARLPDALVPIYSPFLFQYLPSPSRVLSFADPLLHMGVVIRCAAGWINLINLCHFLAYTGACREGTDLEISRSESFAEQSIEHMSMAECVDEVKSRRLAALDAVSFL
jgi:hormone-sensitive lipase